MSGVELNVTSTYHKGPFTLNVDVNAATLLTVLINLGLQLILGANCAWYIKKFISN